MPDDRMIPVKVDQLFLSNVGFVVLLKSQADERSLPIFIGAAEAQAIALQINHVEVPRPLTHDLLKNVLDFMECRLMKMEVCDLKDGTFFARLVLERDGTLMTLDCRPSDAIALALRADAPMFVCEAVMNEAGRDMVHVENKDETQALHGKPAKKEVSPEQQLTRKLEKAIQEERYEDAAKLRDDLKRLKNTHSEN
jgi:uncharacterized protein